MRIAPHHLRSLSQVEAMFDKAQINWGPPIGELLSHACHLAQRAHTELNRISDDLARARRKLMRAKRDHQASQIKTAALEDRVQALEMALLHAIPHPADIVWCKGQLCAGASSVLLYARKAQPRSYLWRTRGGCPVSGCNACGSGGDAGAPSIATGVLCHADIVGQPVRNAAPQCRRPQVCSCSIHGVYGTYARCWG